MIELFVTPAGHLRGRPTGGTAAGPAVLARVAEAFASAGTGAGLFRLGALRDPGAVQPAVSFWRDFANRYLTSLCHTPETAERIEPLEPPQGAELTQILLSVPPMRGAEYLTAAVLEETWRAIDTWVRAAIDTCGGLAAFLREHAPHWRQVGRVCFHLAENKDDPGYPFAFLATYASGLTRAGRLRYLPLARALEEYAGARNKKALLRLLTPVEAAARSSDLVAGLVASGEIYRPYPFTPDEAYRFLREAPAYEEAGVLVRIPDWWKKRPRLRAVVRVGDQTPARIGAEALLDFQVGAAVGDQQLGDAELEEVLAAGSGLRFVKGRWVEVDAEKLRQVLDHWRQVEAEAGDGISLHEGMRLLAGAGIEADDGAPELAEWSFVDAGAWLRRLLEAVRSPEQLAHARPGRALKGRLRPYQAAGLDWLWLLTELGLGACLADDMGLGKTIQVIGLLLMQKRTHPDRPPSLVVVPASLLSNWQSEIERFGPSLRCVYLHPSMTERSRMEQLAEGGTLAGVDAVLTTYAMLSRQAWLRERGWNLAVLDEAHAIKNPSARQTRSAKQVRARARIGLTGTPVENRLGDLWSLFDFLNPGLLGSAARFRRFVRALDKRQDERYAPLRSLVRPYILRRLKTDRSVISDLPEKTQVRAFCHLTKQQAALYRGTVDDMARQLDTAGGIQRRGLVLSYLMRFKQICNHPSQLTGDGAFPPEDSGKFERLRELCEEIASRQEKVLVFTQFRELTEPLAGFLGEVFGQAGAVLHGGTPVKERTHIVSRFQDEGGPPFFVLSLKAGGAGLNLTAASHVVHFDRWWNPAVEDQATDRAFRIGQQKNVLVHKFVCRGTVEERIDELIEGKSQMAEQVLDTDGERALTEMSDEELVELVALDVERASA